MAGNVTQKLQLAREGTAGTLETADYTVWRGDGGGMIKFDDDTKLVPEKLGLNAQTTRNWKSRLGATANLGAREATYEEICHLFEMGLLTVTAAADGSGSSGYIYSYAMPVNSEPALKYYSVQSGDSQQARAMSYTFAETINLSWEAMDDFKMSATLRGRESTLANSGNFYGSSIPTVEVIKGGLGTAYIDDAQAFPATTQTVATMLKGDIAIATGLKPKYTSDDNSLAFNYVYRDNSVFKATGSLTVEHNATGTGLVADYVAGQAKTIRLVWTGAAYATAGSGTTYTNKTIIIDMQVVLTDVSELEDKDGNSVFTLNFESGINEAESEHLTITVVNELSALEG